MVMAYKILILCTGNSCRSQMAEAFLQSFDANLQVSSAGTKPAGSVNSFAIRVMNEIGIDISCSRPKQVAGFINDSFDYVITVCDAARETCPVFTGKVENRVHMGFEDPAEAVGTDEEILSEFRRVRDEIKKEFYKFYMEVLRNEQQ